MAWRLAHWLFGWDYIQWTNFADQGVARVYADHNGRAYYWRYKAVHLADEIRQPEQVLWLTCEPSKYMAATHSQEPK